MTVFDFDDILFVGLWSQVYGLNWLKIWWEATRDHKPTQNVIIM